ncbi:MAG TPA: hypothetical protein VG096_26505 [Bryobacteraceae bacterium]|jgi:hypothetical protein|nr:hypothetical protein [Bryobacteraceae bacterium]
MTYESSELIESQLAQGVTFTIAKMSYGRRVELMRRIRELSRRFEFLSAGSEPGDKMDAALLETEINRMHLTWGLLAVSGLTLDGTQATPDLLAESGPEDLFHEALAAVQKQTGLTEAERKN